MPERRLGLVVSGEVITVVDAQIPDDADEPVEILADHTWRLQAGARPEAYEVMRRICSDYIRENNITRVMIKASEIGGTTKLAHLESAELRGVIVCASAAVSTVGVVRKSVVSRTFGDRKVDEYLKDDDFWAQNTEGGRLRRASREAAMLLIATRGS
jgi:hypothetical protein